MSTPPINAMQAQSSRGQRGGYSRGGGRGRGNGGLRAPLQQFRSWKGGILSVTDLVGPSWCELQFDYALRQQRHRKLADRPASFVTAEGKTIHVAQDLASQNDRTVARGKSIHKALERGVQPDSPPVQATTTEERWGLRLINMLVALQTLMKVGYCREMPVFGIVHDQVVTGIIDEIVRKPTQLETQPDTKNVAIPSKRGAPSPPFEHAAKKIKYDASEDQPQTSTSLSPGLHISTAPPAAGSEPTRYTLHLSDTKTRTEPTLPPDEDTLSSRFQLMLYHRLLSDLIAPAAPTVQARAPLSFVTLWRRVNANPQRRFSQRFLTQAGPLIAQIASRDAPAQTTAAAKAGTARLSCLNDLTTAWTHAVKALNVTAIDHTLTLVYRSQITRKRSKVQSQSTSADTEPSSQEAQGSTALEGPSKLSEGSASAPLAPDALARAIQQSLPPANEDAAAMTKVADGTDAHATPASEGEHPSVPNDNFADKQPGTIATEKEEGVESGTKTAPASPAPSDELVEAHETMTVAELDVEARVIGTKAFQLDDALLDRYLTHILAWWRGQRAAEGVSGELTRRCTRGCEWREKQAQEAEKCRASGAQAGGEPSTPIGL
ncbi:uncharacterized protein TRAVEDRAFT_58347 [Trametes versicolor FP-101664 SS1]|uniref:uncharacterized protein n=1 Tax=Trametes versicolor (strain FP-101664) TaxID=717944 RepID=UPI000462305E|nr:uncharacterized protein TRAVEDRAFT_58347 [Trametes versicolor FP-101664 SS1]EIW59587.1 hypothetical protein TRAVEDRAFT_58347 [Trametes versicolor FP-101664 SS1]